MNKQEAENETEADRMKTMGILQHSDRRLTKVEERLTKVEETLTKVEETLVRVEKVRIQIMHRINSPLF